jgi:hypothetical protein
MTATTIADTARHEQRKRIIRLASVFHERGWQADDGEVGPFWGGHARLVSDLA